MTLSQDANRLYILIKKSDLKFLVDTGAVVCTIPNIPAMHNSKKIDAEFFYAVEKYKFMVLMLNGSSIF